MRTGRSGFGAGHLRALTDWWPGRQRLVALVVLLAVLTAAAGAALGASGWHVRGAVAYVAVVVVALFAPAAIAGQVIGGLLLAGSILLGQNAPAPLLLLPVVASVVATAELLAVVGRVGTPLERVPGDELHRVGRATLIGSGVFSAVALVGAVPGPGGHLAIALASAACLVLAVLLVRNAHE